MSKIRRPNLNGLESLAKKGFQVEFLSHAKAILNVDFPDALAELETVLDKLSIPIESLIKGGGGEHETTQGLRKALAAQGWNKHKFEIKKFIDGDERESISHEVDHVRSFSDGKLAMEIEWNNKDPFFDRDLENFKRLHAEGAISAGIVLTRGTSLQTNVKNAVKRFAEERNINSYIDLKDFVSPTTRQRDDVDRRVRHASCSFSEAWAASFCADKFGTATTHWGKLEDRIKRGVGSPCPLLLIGIPYEVITFC
jgi:hypothetical protein